MYLDYYYWVLVMPTVLLALYAQYKVKSTYQKYSQRQNAMGYSGHAIAERILEFAGLYDVGIEHIQGQLTDHYDPRAKILRLSDSVDHSTSIAAAGVAAHEVGHAIQHQQGYVPLKIRNAIIPVTQIGSRMAMPMILLGVLFGYNQGQSSLGWFLVKAGIVLFSAAVIFQLITLPVEFNASSRALKILKENHLLQEDELPGARAVLSAAALTYVAAAAQALASLLRLLLIFGRRGSRDDR